jgi:pilus assembly protein TadC
VTAALALLWALAVLGAARARPLAVPPSPPRWAAPAAAGLVAGALAPPLVPVGAAAVLVPRWWRARRAARRAGRAPAAELPDLVDLLALAIGAGCNVRLAVAAVAPRAPPAFSAAFTEAIARTERGERLADALVDASSPLGEPGRAVVTLLVAAERYGSPLLPALERLAADARADRRRRAEEAARRLPVALLFPLVLCVLPSFGLLTLVPLLAGAVGSLGR